MQITQLPCCAMHLVQHQPAGVKHRVVEVVVAEFGYLIVGAGNRQTHQFALRKHCCRQFAFRCVGGGRYMFFPVECRNTALLVRAGV